MGIVLLILSVIKTKQSKTKLDHWQPQKAQEGKDSEEIKAASSPGGGVSSWGPGGCNNQISSYLWHTSTRPHSHPQRHRQQIETYPLFLVKDAYFLAQELWPEGQAHFKGHSREAKA